MILVNKNNLINKIQEFEDYIYSHKDVARSAIINYNSFGKEESKYSNKLIENDMSDITLKRFHIAIGFTYRDILSDIKRTQTFDKKNSNLLTEYEQLKAITLEVIKELRKTPY